MQAAGQAARAVQAASAAGGGLYVSGGKLTLEGSTTTFNSNEAAVGVGGTGGAGGNGLGGSGGFGFSPGAGKGGGDRRCWGRRRREAPAAREVPGKAVPSSTPQNGAISSTAAVVLVLEFRHRRPGWLRGQRRERTWRQGRARWEQHRPADLAGSGGPAGVMPSAAMPAMRDGGVGEGGGIFNSAAATITFTGGKNT